MRPIAARFTEVLNFRVLMVLAILAGVLAMQAGRGTLAYFTSTASSTGNTFTAGTVLLELTDANETALSSVAGSITASNSSFRPGQTVVGFITVENNGTLPFDYGLKYTATNGATNLIVGGATDPELEVYSAAATTDCTVANVTGAETNLTSVYGAQDLSTTANTVVFDSGGVTKRAVAAGSEEVLCLAVTWPNGAAGVENAQQGGSATIVFNFDARQQ